uniref:Uncharacterized protein n=1 Tax=Timema monikensis TaxID=170555 RepID=A0A7R9HN90_9NEOP|nr:unnamed protein product [Timema monikensis]
MLQRLPSVIAAHALVNTPSKLWGSLKVTRAPSGQQDIKVELEFPWWTGSAKGRVSRPGPRRIETAVEAEWTPRGGKTGGVTLKGSLDDLSKARTVVFKGTLEAKGAVDVSLVAGLSSRSSNMNLWVIGTRGEDTFSGNITCSRDSHYSLTTSAQVGPKTYFTKLVLLNEESEKAIAVDLRLVRRLTLASKITFKGEEKGLEFEMSWDKDSDPEKRVSFLARSDHDKRELFIEVPGDYARAEMSTLPDGMRGTLEWSGQKKVDSLFTWDSGPGSGGVLVKLSTPFVGLEAQTLGARYSLIEQQLVVEGEISCQGKEARLEAHVTADRASPSVLNVTGSLTVNSSFPLIPSVTAHLDHHDTNTLTRSITTSLQFKHTDWHSQLLSEWTLSDAMLEGNVSWEGVGQSLSTDLYFLSGHDNLDARLQVSWSEKKRRTVSVEVKSERGSRFHKLFRVITPFDDFRDSHLELINRNDGSHMKADLMLMPIMMAGMEVKGRGNETKERRR